MDLHMQTDAVGTGFRATSANREKEEKEPADWTPTTPHVDCTCMKHMGRPRIKTQRFGPG